MSKLCFSLHIGACRSILSYHIVVNVFGKYYFKRHSSSGYLPYIPILLKYKFGAQEFTPLTLHALPLQYE